MGRVPCCEKDNVKRGQWTPEEDNKLASYIAQHGTRNWRLIPKNAGLQRCGKSCRLRWTNYLRPDLKHGQFSEAEEQTIVKLHSIVGNRWSLIAGQLPGRTDNDVKNHWNTKLKKKLSGMGIDPVTHKPFSHLMAEIATTLHPPQVSHLAEAALGCFKDEMLHLLTKKRVDQTGIQLQHDGSELAQGSADQAAEDSTADRIRANLSRAVKDQPENKMIWDSSASCGACPPGPPLGGFHYGGSPSLGNGEGGSPWRQMSLQCTDSAGETHRRIVEDENLRGEKGGFESDSVLWDLQADDLIDHMV